MSIILGINAFHADSAACLVVDGILVGAVAEERLGPRIKHTSDFPEHAIRRLLEDSNLRLRDVTHVAIPRNPHTNYLSKISHVSKNPLKTMGAVFQHFHRNFNSNGLREKLSNICQEDLARLQFEIVEVEHHLAHIASAYFLSPFETLTAGFSYDGSGDFVSMMAARCQGHNIEVLSRVGLPNSLGFFYTALCQFIGFNQFGEEYKVMGLAPYGEDLYRDEMSKLVELNANGWFKLGRGYFGMHEGGDSVAKDEHGFVKHDTFYKKHLVQLLGQPRDRLELITQREMNIARSTQVRFEEAAVHCLSHLHSLVPTNQLAMAGGCALNGVTNARALRETPFVNQYIQSASSDDGTCLGAAFYVWNQVLGRSERFHMNHAFWGPEYSYSRVKSVAQASEFFQKECINDEDLVNDTSKLIEEGLVVGWYQGRSEWGPRALGNRSILANPAISSMKDTINKKIKRRESFRPFAPSVLLEDVEKYFEQKVESPFMMHVVKIRPEWREKLPAITHVDGTGRLQTVDVGSNPLYHRLISAFKIRTGIGMVLNTSFNENEPVVDTPEQALDCFNRTDMDALVLGRFILKKKRQ